MTRLRYNRAGLLQAVTATLNQDYEDYAGPLHPGQRKPLQSVMFSHLAEGSAYFMTYDGRKSYESSCTIGAVFGYLSQSLTAGQAPSYAYVIAARLALKL